MRRIITVLTIFGFFLSGCTPSKKVIDETSASNKNIPPGECRIAAQVIKIDSTLSGGASDPCSKAPCVAWIQIKRVIGYGAGSSGLNDGDTLKTKFAFTLSPTTKDTFPTLKDNLPGLTEGSSFVADIQLVPANPSSVKKEKVYLIYGYNKTN